MKYNGRDFLLEVYDDPDWLSCTSDRSTSFKIGNEQVDVTAKGDSQWRQLIACGIRSGEVSCNGVWADKEVLDILLSASVNGTPIVARVVHGPSKDVVSQGTFSVQSCERTGEHNGAEQYSLSLVSANELSNGSPLNQPVITSALSVDGIRSTPFSYFVEASNSPTSFDATGLPDGLSVNIITGEISGTPTSGGSSNVTISATNSAGTGYAVLSLEVSDTQIRVIAANYSGVAGTLRAGVWGTENPIAGKIINCARWSGSMWFAVCTDGTVHKSADGDNWTYTGLTVSVENRLCCRDNVVLVDDFGSNLRVSLDAGVTWTTHTPYSGSPHTYNALYIHPLGGGVYRLCVGGQSGTGTTSGRIATADTNAMPTPGVAWTPRFSGATATVYTIGYGVGDTLVGVSTLPSGNIAVLQSTDGVSWTVTNTGVNAVNGRSITYSSLYSLYFIGASSGVVVTSPDLVVFTTALTGLGNSIDSWCDSDGKLYCGSGTACWEVTPTTKTQRATGSIQFVGGIGESV